MIHDYGHFNAIYRELLKDIIYSGQRVSPRGKGTIELIGAKFHLANGRDSILVSPERKLNIPFMLAEPVWMWLGSNEADLIVPYNKNMRLFTEHGRLMGAYGPKIMEGMPYVMDVLTKDPDSRQAVIELWRPRPYSSKDIPCTLSFQFLARYPDGVQPDDANPLAGRELIMIVTMRSNDAWLGLPYDVFTFTTIQQLFALKLGIQPGEYVHQVGSLHLYDEHVERATKVIEEDPDWNPTNIIDAEMIPSFKSMFAGITWMGATGGGKDVEGWLSGNADWMPQPWGDWLRVLAYRFHGNKALVPDFWQRIMRGSYDG